MLGFPFTLSSARDAIPAGCTSIEGHRPPARWNHWLRTSALAWLDARRCSRKFENTSSARARRFRRQEIRERRSSVAGRRHGLPRVRNWRRQENFWPTRIAGMLAEARCRVLPGDGRVT